MTQTLTQQIANTLWHRLTGRQMEELLTEWFRYMDHEDIVRIIYDSAPLIPHTLRKKLEQRDWLYGSVYDRECEEIDFDTRKMP